MLCAVQEEEDFKNFNLNFVVAVDEGVCVGVED
jgi:hypothetical protein